MPYMNPFRNREFQLKPFADSANGLTGGQTAASRRNGAVQAAVARSGAGDPLKDFLATVSQWNPGTAGPQTASVTAASTVTPEPTPETGVNPQPTPQPTPAPTPQPAPAPGPETKYGTPDPTKPIGEPDVIGVQPPGFVLGDPQFDKFEDGTTNYENIAYRYAQNPGYGWVTGDIVKQYQDQMFANPQVFQDVDFVDWAAAMGFESPEAGRRGYDTYNFTAPGVPRQLPDQGNGGGENDYWHGGGWLSGGNPYTGPGSTANPDVPGPGGGKDPGGEGGAPGEPQGIETMLQKLNEYFRRIRSEGARDVASMAANRGFLDSGAYGQALGDMLSSVSAAQSREGAGFLGDEANRALQKFLGELSSSTQRYGYDKGLEGSLAQANAMGASASANAAAARDAARMQYELGLKELGFRDIWDQRDYDLGVHGLGTDVYRTDQQTLLSLLQFLYGTSPDARIGDAFQMPNNNPLWWLQ